MATTDLTRSGLNYQKRGVCVVVGLALAEADLLVDGAVIANLPERSIITSAMINVTTVSGTATATLDILVDTDLIADEIAVTVAGVIQGSVATGTAYQETGGEVIVKAGAVPPAAGDLVCDLILEYIELDKVTGELTRFKDA